MMGTLNIDTDSYTRTWSPGQIVPYPCVAIDAEFNHFVQACWKSLKSRQSSRHFITAELQTLFATRHGPSNYLPCLSVRSAFHTFLKACRFPRGSEIIMSAINIPDMVKIAHFHGLKVVPMDVNMDTLGPKFELLELLISDKTVAILVAHLFGRWNDVSQAVEVAHKHNLCFIEDAAQAFNGFHNLGNPNSDLVLLSFGTMKHSTSFGGAIAKIKEENMFLKMEDAQTKYPLQTNNQYLLKVIKNCMLYPTLSLPLLNKGIRYCLNMVGVSSRRFLRVFTPALVEDLSRQPSTAMLATMLERLQGFSLEEQAMRRLKAEFVCHHLPIGAQVLGMKAKQVDYWLFPILVNDPARVVSKLNEMGIDANSQDITQLHVIEPDAGISLRKMLPPPNYPLQVLGSTSGLMDQVCFLDMWNLMRLNLYPREAKYVMEHVLYLPVHKWVPFEQLLFVCQGLKLALVMSEDSVPLTTTNRLVSKL